MQHKFFRTTGLFALGTLLAAGCTAHRETLVTITDTGAKLAQIRFAGLRSSWYGVDYPFTNDQWKTMDGNLSGFFPAPPASVNLWIVGALMSPGVCDLEFSGPDSGLQTPGYVSFRPKKIDHEKILSFFDTTGIRVFLQVEPGRADIDTLIDLVLGRFGSHPSVAGFGIDVEWLDVDSETNATTRVTDSLAQHWEQRVKSFNGSYRLFLKHWETSCMPSHYRGDIIFIDDSQGFSSLDAMSVEFGRWADYFSPSPVMFQVGYDEDYSWWKQLTNPPREIGEHIALTTKGYDQDIGIIWVDFTLQPDNYPELAQLFAGIK